MTREERREYMRRYMLEYKRNIVYRCPNKRGKIDRIIDGVPYSFPVREPEFRREAMTIYEFTLLVVEKFISEYGRVIDGELLLVR